ncbi:hypothetical protein WK13_34745 [Burkholderia ubonensis]|uniref:hypothetical protein n=1 Tax=Burkholderia ubonensis TaxID=101571 RepID=UPI00075C8E84|nr:hypothetical protein [Burkholderia ubonensis]KVR21699.1 hypothetical protein WK13_34745 [Burkholderia ubonensis]
MRSKAVDHRERLLKIKDIAFANVVEQEVRLGITQTLSDIRSGSVSEDALDGLQNWCMTMLVAQMEMTPLQYNGCRQRALQLSVAVGNPLRDDLPVPMPGQSATGDH